MDVMTYYSFYITYSFLLTTGTITFIEAMRTNIVPMRHILNLETCISIVAAYFYGKFITIIDKNKVGEFDNKSEAELQREINVTRYVDWSITTPIMLLVLVLAFRYNSGKHGINFIDYVIILIMNYAMLGFGYLGEIGTLSKIMANAIGFVFFAGLYGFVFMKYMMTDSGKVINNPDNNLLFYSFLILWSLYGVFYQMSESFKNIGFNVLDLLSKCFVGIYFWSYSSGIFMNKPLK
jgi:bacteriorhodopsin